MRVTFISGVDANGKVAADQLLHDAVQRRRVGDGAGAVRRPKHRHQVGQSDARPGERRGHQYWFADASGWTEHREVRVGRHLRLLERASPTSISSSPRERRRRQHHGDPRQRRRRPTPTSIPPARSRSAATIVQAPTSGAIISVDTTGSGYGPINLDSSTAHGYVWSTLIHEVGHIVGLGHGGPYNSIVNTRAAAIRRLRQPAVGDHVVRQRQRSGDALLRRLRRRYVQWTDLGRDPLNTNYNPLSPQMLDILAAQRLYGASTNATFNGCDTYGFNSTFTDDYFQADLRLQHRPQPVGHRHDLEPRHRQHARPLGLRRERHGRPHARHLLERRRPHATTSPSPSTPLRRERRRRQRLTTRSAPPTSPPTCRAAMATTC